jgi:hypothetical protein
MSEIHVAFPCHGGYLYLAKWADLPHYQGVFVEFMAKLKRYEGDLKVYLYLPNYDYDNHFLIVWNSSMLVQRFVDCIDWMEVHQLATTKVPTTMKEKTNNKK